MSLRQCVGADSRSKILAPKTKLRDGAEMPVLALETFLAFDKNGVVSNRHHFHKMVAHAIDIGYRHIDTAPDYQTEAEIGKAISMKLNEGVIIRKDLYITIKLWNTCHRRKQVMEFLLQSLARTRLNYVDLYLMNWPVGLNKDNTYSDVDYMETWRGMEDAVRHGLVRSIGVSNFNKQQLQRVLAEATFKPVALQIEVHPQLIQTELIDFCRSEGIVVLGYNPPVSFAIRFSLDTTGSKVTDTLLISLARKYGKNPRQVVLRWAIDRGVVPLPKSLNTTHLAENLDIFDFQLEKYEIDLINQYNCNKRYIFPTFWQDHPYYPFERVNNPS